MPPEPDRPDPRLTPARPDLAAAHLRGTVDAAAYAEAEPARVAVGATGLHRAPADDAPLDTELLYGERFDIYERKAGWAWGQAQVDGYVGYVPEGALAASHQAAPGESAPGESAPGELDMATHTVAVLRTYAFSAPDIKSRPNALLSINAQLRVTAREGRFCHDPAIGFLVADHLAPAGEPAHDFVAVAEQFAGTPYLWGGRQSLGIDCSGLVQMALARAGIPAPRDTDMQERALGQPLETGPSLDGLKRGDLVFWKGHVGIMTSPTDFVHANATHMMTVIEPLAPAAARIARTDGPITSIRRL